jgi:hypothetical protein
VATIGEIAAEVDWVWVFCEARLPTGASCGHRSAVKLADAIAIFGADASTDAIRRKARCSVCGGKGQSAIKPAELHQRDRRMAEVPWAMIGMKTPARWPGLLGPPRCGSGPKGLAAVAKARSLWPDMPGRTRLRPIERIARSRLRESPGR